MRGVGSTGVLVGRCWGSVWVRRGLLRRGGSVRQGRAEAVRIAFHSDQQWQSVPGQSDESVGNIARVHTDPGGDLVDCRFAHVGERGEYTSVGGVGNSHALEDNGR